jgi:hypothetical protein
MGGHLLGWVAGTVAAIATATVAALSTRVQLLPDVIDISSIPTGSGVLSLALVSYGALRRLDPDRMARLSLLHSLGRTVRGSSPAGLPHRRCSLVTMVRALMPFIVVAVLIEAAGFAAYAFGKPAWVVYASMVLAALAMLPGVERWERRDRGERSS